MMKKAGKIRSIQTFRNLEKIARGGEARCAPSCAAEDEPLDLTSLARQPIQVVADTSRTLRMKKFRAQLLHRWLVQNVAPCRVGDIGGGKGLLSYLLIRDGWQATVIDPYDQPLPDKYKDITTGQRVKIPPEARVPHITAPFQVELGAQFDLLVGMHAHGSNAMVIDAAERYGCGFVLFPCCVIDEPFFPRLGVQWIEALADYAARKGLEIRPFRLNFKGQNIGIYHQGERLGE
jgi:hypothetical protein